MAQLSYTAHDSNSDRTKSKEVEMERLLVMLSLGGVLLAVAGIFDMILFSEPVIIFVYGLAIVHLVLSRIRNYE